MIELGFPSPPCNLGIKTEIVSYVAFLITEKSPAGEEGQFELALIIEISLFM
jgi:hypothetical protein